MQQHASLDSGCAFLEFDAFIQKWGIFGQPVLRSPEPLLAILAIKGLYGKL
jgi:hypothetical protein